LVYALFGFLILPPILRAVAVRQLAKELHRVVALEKVRLNPFVLSLTARGLKIQDPDGGTLLSWDELYVNFQLSSLFSRDWTFKEIALVNPCARVQVNPDGSLNISDILASRSRTNAASVRPARLPLLRVGRLRIEGARLALADLTTRTPYRRLIGPVNLSVTDFHTDPNNSNPHVFTGTIDTGETFSWGGRFSTDPPGARGELGVDNLSLKNFAPLYEDLVNFEIRDGVVGFHVNYDFALGPASRRAALSNASFTLRSFKLAAPGAGENLLELPEVTVAGFSGDVLARRIDVDSVAVQGVEFNLTRESGAGFNVLAAAQPRTNPHAPRGLMLLMGSLTNAFAQLLQSTNLASLTVRNLSVQEGAFTLRDDSLSPPARLRVDQVSLAATNLSNRPATNLLAAFSLRWNTNGTLRTGLDASLRPLNADLTLQLDRIELAPLSPYLRPFMRLSALGSKLGIDGVFRIRSVPDLPPAVTFTGGIALDDFKLVTADTGEDFLKWGTLRFEGVAAGLNPPAVAVTNVTIKDLAVQVAIETNGALNLSSVVRPAGVAPSGPGAAAGASLAAETGGSVLKRAFAPVKTLLGMQTNAFSSLPKFEVGALTVDNAELRFTDRSVTPPAHLAIEQVNATVQNLATEELRRAQVHLTALAGGTGPVELTAQLHPLRASQATEAKLTLRKVQLLPADPYAAKFLGYRLARGDLNLDLDYTINASRVNGSNLIVLDQPTLGAKAASTNATHLPVKLALALLKDSSGRVELDVPVQGNLDDPAFRLGPVIGHVIANVFVKAVTSPFALLGSLVGGKGGEEMQFQEFAPGSAELDAAARAKLVTLAKALAARPGLEVVIEGNVHLERDGWALRHARMEQQLRARRWSALRPSARENLKPDEVALVPEIRASLVEAAYRDLVRTNPALASVAVPEAVLLSRTNPPAAPGARVDEGVEKGATRLMQGGRALAHAPAPPSAGSAGSASGPAAPAPGPAQLGLEQMENSLTAAQPLTDADYAALTLARARQVQSNLVQELHIAAERVLVSEGGAGSTNRSCVVLQLQ
jgi:uncharacterized protein involved in outer membrane biogenesis